MLGVVSSVSIGYLLGSINPAALIAVMKNIDLREYGTKNLGATNVTLTLGFSKGLFVMLVDLLKAFFSVKVVKWLFPQVRALAALAGCCCVIGHIFPVFLHFRGGKGLAAFGGMILALDPGAFLILLVIGLMMILITDYPIFLTLSAVTLAPYLMALRSESFGIFFVVLLACILVFYKHWENVLKIKNGTERKLSVFLREKRKLN